MIFSLYYKLTLHRNRVRIETFLIFSILCFFSFPLFTLDYKLNIVYQFKKYYLPKYKQKRHLFIEYFEISSFLMEGGD